MLAGNLLVGRLVTFPIPRFLRRLQRPENKENSEICRQRSKKVQSHKDINGNKTTNINTLPNTNIHKYKHTRGQKHKYNNHINISANTEKAQTQKKPQKCKPTHRRKTETQL